MSHNIGNLVSNCFDGPCKPWTHLGCRSCAVRPFKFYQGNGNAKDDRQYCQENGIGMMVSPGGCTSPQNFPGFAVDNGAFSAYINESKWDGQKYKRYLANLISKGAPDFIITPDRVAKGNKSLRFSVAWAKWIRKKHPEVRQYLAVQDGMEPEDLLPYLWMFDGIFVGGSLDWKYQTAQMWVNFAHYHGKPCHIGRIGTWDKIVWAMRIGADSIDSSSWAQNGSWHHIEYAKAQKILEVA